MNHLKRICLFLLTLMYCSAVYAESSYNISELYSVYKPEAGTIAVGSFSTTENVEYILTPTKVDIGKYSVEVKKIGDNLYQVKDSDICVKTRYCYEWAGFSEKVILIVDSNYGYTKGKIIFD